MCAYVRGDNPRVLTFEVLPVQTYLCKPYNNFKVLFITQAYNDVTTCIEQNNVLTCIDTCT